MKYTPTEPRPSILNNRNTSKVRTRRWGSILCRKHSWSWTTPVLCALLLILLAMLTACRSTADPFELDLSRREYFQKAIEASDTNNYSLALKYYQAFQQKFPDDFSGNLWASYEIAFCYHKMGRDKQAAELFRALLDRYEQLAEDKNVNEEAVPLGPQILAEKVLAKIEPKSDQGKTKESTERE